MNSAYLWLLAGCAALAGIAFWKPSTPSAGAQRFVLFWLLTFAILLEGGRTLARHLGHPEHAELGIWSYFALASLCFLLALRDPFNIPGTRGAHLPPRARHFLRALLAACGLALLSLGVHRDRRILAVYRQCRGLYAAAPTPVARRAAGAQVLDPGIRAYAPSGFNPGAALTCSDILAP